jgi:hypothetical protein
VHLSVGNSGFLPQQFTETRARAVFAADALAAPGIEAGLQTVSVSVSGTIELAAAD